MKLSINHRDEFPKILTERGAKTGVELGVFRGDYAHTLLSGWGGSLTGVDCYNNGTEFEILMDAISKNLEYIKAGRYRIIVLNSAVAAGYFKDEEIDFVFADAGHYSHEVFWDILAWWPKIKSDGIMCGHDYDANVPEMASGGVNLFMTGNPYLDLHITPDGSWWIIKP